MFDNQTRRRFNWAQPLGLFVRLLLYVTWWPIAYDHRNNQWRPWAQYGPNALTVIRLIGGLVVAPWLLWSMWFQPLGHSSPTEVWLFWSLMGLLFTDYLDGEMARMMNSVSKWGMRWDPLADKPPIVIVFGGMLFLMGRLLPDGAWLARTLLVLAVLIELALYRKAGQQTLVADKVTALQRVVQHAVYANESFDVKANFAGKVKFNLQCLVLFGFLAYYIWSPSWLIHLGGMQTLQYCLCMGVLLALYDYTRRHMHYLHLLNVKADLEVALRGAGTTVA